MTYLVAVDTGGTFTAIAVFDPPGRAGGGAAGPDAFRALMQPEVAEFRRLAAVMGIRPE